MAVKKVMLRGQLKWRARVVAPDGRQITKFRDRKDEAQEAEKELLAQVRAVRDEPPEERKVKEVPTFEVFSKDYLERCSTTNRPRYAREKGRIVEKCLLPYFGGKKLDEIGLRAIDTYRSSRSQTVAPKTINEEVGVLLHALSVAQTWELITSVPKVKPLKTVQAEISYLDDDEADRLLEAARKVKGPWHPMVLCALHAGLRLGELRGLRWRDVDTVAGRLVVRVSADDHDTLHAPKSGKAREIPLSSTLQGALKTHRHLRSEHVFCNDDGSILREDQCRHALQRIVRRAGLAVDVRWHRLRHTFASNLMRRGAPPRTVQDLLGHSTLNMTLRYSHLSPLDRRVAVELLDSGSGVNSGVNTRVERS